MHSRSAKQRRLATRNGKLITHVSSAARVQCITRWRERGCGGWDRFVNRRLRLDSVPRAVAGANSSAGSRILVARHREPPPSQDSHCSTPASGSLATASRMPVSSRYPTRPPRVRRSSPTGDPQRASIVAFTEPARHPNSSPARNTPSRAKNQPQSAQTCGGDVSPRAMLPLDRGPALDPETTRDPKYV